MVHRSFGHYDRGGGGVWFEDVWGGGGGPALIALVIFIAALSLMIHNAQFLIKLALLSNVVTLSFISTMYVTSGCDGEGVSMIMNCVDYQGARAEPNCRGRV